MILLALFAAAHLARGAESALVTRKPAGNFRAGVFTCAIGSGDIGQGDDGTGLGSVVASTCDVSKPFSVSVTDKRYTICCTGSATLPKAKD